MNRAALAFAVASALAVGSAAARAQSTPTGDEAELNDLMNVLADETDVATRSRQNADYVPGIISVVSGDEARALGARTALDAVGLLPGLQVERDPTGAPTLTVRGINAFFNNGNVKLLVDGLDVSFGVAGLNSSTLLIPIELVDRIEVIRGPGSVVFGDFALNGLINIVTLTDRRDVYLGAGSGGRLRGGGNWHGGGDWPWSLSVSHEQSDRYDAPEPRGGDDAHEFIDFAIAHAGFSLKAAGIARRVERPGPDPNASDVVDGDHAKALELRYDAHPAERQRIGAWLRWSDANFDTPPLGFRGQRYELGADADWRWGAHHWLVEATAGALDVDRSILPQAGPPPPGVPMPPSIRPAAISAHLPSQALLLQDQFDLAPELALTLGARYDRFSDVTTRVTPRAALVWRASPDDTVKAQYGEGFRPPITVELYDSGNRNRNLDFEVAKTREIEWIHRQHDNVFRASAFSERVDGRLNPAGPAGAGFRNRGFGRTRGVELEADLRLAETLRLIGNLTKFGTLGSNTRPPGSRVPPTSELPGAADWLGNLGVIAQPTSDWTVGAHLQHVGERFENSGSVKGYNAINLLVEHRFSAIEGLSLTASLRNATDANVTSIVARPPPQSIVLLDYSGRQALIELDWRW